MKSLLTFLLFLTLAAAKAQTITPEQAKDSIGKTVTVCGEVTGTHSTDKVSFLNLGGKYPNNAFTVVVFAADVTKLSYQLSTLNGKNICVSGKVKDYNGKPEIVVEDEKQITIKEEKRD